MSEERKGSWTQTYTGRAFFPLDPRPSDINRQDIAHALSQICRFGGHTTVPYSIAQHSIGVSQLCPPELKLFGLLHDASEAYMGDIITPIKHHPSMQVLVDMEDKIMAAIMEHFGLTWTGQLPPAVHEADKIMLVTEARDLLATEPEWTHQMPYKPLQRKIVPLDSKTIERLFLERLEELTR